MQENIKKLLDELEELDWSFEDICLSPEQVHLFISLILRDVIKWQKLAADPIQMKNLMVYLDV